MTHSQFSPGYAKTAKDFTKLFHYDIVSSSFAVMVSRQKSKVGGCHCDPACILFDGKGTKMRFFMF